MKLYVDGVIESEEQFYQFYKGSKVDDRVILHAQITTSGTKSFVILGEVANGVERLPWNGYTNIFEATAEEVLEATSRIKNHRLTAPNGGNYDYLKGTVNNVDVDNKFWRSGAVQEGEPQIFNAIQVEGSNGSTWLRNTDSEYKMLNKLASDLGGTPNAVKTNITGELKIISENPYCASCTGIIQQFHDMFPNVKLILIDGAK